MLQYVASSSNRVAGLAKYFVVLAGSFNEAPPADTRSSTSAKRRQLHILYLLHDLLHHTKYHLDGNVAFSTVSGSLQPFMVDLLGHAAAYDQQKHPKHHNRLDQLLDLWSYGQYFSPELIQKLRDVVRNGATVVSALPSSNDVLVGEADTTRKQPGKNAPVIVPSTHGDSARLRHDLPAGNLVPHVIPHSSIPVQADSMKPLQFLAGPAASELVQTLKSFLKDARLTIGTEELINYADNLAIDGLALRGPQNEIAGDSLDGETYFAWSSAFDQQTQQGVSDGSPSRSRSRSRSRSVARNEFKRRRDSDSPMSRDGRRPTNPPWVRDRREESQVRSRSPSERSYSPPPPPPSFPPPVPGAWLGPPPPLPAMSFPSPPPWMAQSAFPPPFPGPPLPMPMPAGQPLPGGQSHFPPSHPGNQQDRPWGARGRGGRNRW